MPSSLSLILASCVLWLPFRASTAPTWPSAFDELEDIMFLNTGYRARAFSGPVTPCGSSADGAGRNAAAEWLRSAFHDASPGSAVGVNKGIGGMDASLMFELTGVFGADNVGAAFNSTLVHLAPFLSSRSSIADLLSLGVYTAVRACGGPIVQIRTGRIDATAHGPSGVPQPQNSIDTFRNQFQRMGFATDAAMIQLVVCGHSLGGVHSVDFPLIVKAGTYPGDVQTFDSTTGAYDEKIAVEYTTGTSKDPLLSGNCHASGRCSDQVIFGADNNVTIKQMADPGTYRSTCATVLQQLIEIVPTGVALTDPITVYEVKPVDLQLAISGDGTSLIFSGEIRILTTTAPFDQISTVQLAYNDRSGAACSGCTINTAFTGAATGFDNTFAFYGFSAQIPASSSISSFRVIVTFSNGGNHINNNNGLGFPVQDTVLYQRAQSCVSGTPDSSGNLALTITAAVLTTASSPTPSLNLTIPVTRLPVPVPSLTFKSVSMTSNSTIGPYLIFSATYAIPAAQRNSVRLDINGATQSITFQGLDYLSATCGSFVTNISSSSLSSSISSASSGISSYLNTSSMPSTTLASTSAVFNKSTTSSSPIATYSAALNLSTAIYSSVFSSTISPSSSGLASLSGLTSSAIPASSSVAVATATSATSSASPSSTAYTYLGCFVDSASNRSIVGDYSGDSAQTIEKCSTYCSSFALFGLEYGAECYCGSTNTGSPARSGDCSMPCGGEVEETCGNGNRLSVYKNALYVPKVNPTIAGYQYAGCFTDPLNPRALAGASTASNTMTPETCAAFCGPGPTYFGMEYGRECYCGASLAAASTQAPESDCSMSCSGNQTNLCGSGSRLSLYERPTTAGGYRYTGCYSDTVSNRVLQGSYTGGNTMTHEVCEQFCSSSSFTYYGLEYAAECYCGNSFANPTTIEPDTDCNMACVANVSETCGAGNRLSMFELIDAVIPTTPVNPTIPGYTYAGCYPDSAGSRLLNATFYYDSSAMTVESCAEFCESYNYFGTEYGQECYCANSFAYTTSIAAESDCDFKCAGAGELCGAGNRLSLYSKQ
ncbi:heme peroxidase [Microthyrium microscopicum]|uniref:Heme peroxidase n=1 Tax=Microthyrium microscopicum TaxID=703497 RepID=A0A6A6UC95_9PEZI|nr:heme peroxidase [Microthyrium microscopicum]